MEHSQPSTTGFRARPSTDTISAAGIPAAHASLDAYRWLEALACSSTGPIACIPAAPVQDC